jgi:hypothetical protein
MQIRFHLQIAGPKKWTTSGGTINSGIVNAGGGKSQKPAKTGQNREFSRARLSKRASESPLNIFNCAG